jgi:hypothetical protein
MLKKVGMVLKEKRVNLSQISFATVLLVNYFMSMTTYIYIMSALRLHWSAL